MPLYIFHKVHPWLLGATFIFVCVGISVAGLILFRKYTDKERLKSSQEAIIAFMNIVAVLYAVLLAFLVIAVWESFDKCQDNVSSEANNLGSLYRNITLLPEPTRSELNKELLAYEDAVINKEFPAMEYGGESKEVKDIIIKIFNTIARYQSLLDKESVVFNGIYKDFNEMLDCRRLRLIASTEEIPSVLWLTLIAGTIAVVFFSYYFHIEHFKTHIIFTIVIGAIIGLTLFLVFVLEHPFQDPWKISPEVFSKMHNISG